MSEERNRKSLGYSLFYAVTYLHARLPFSFLYVLSDILYFFTYHVVRYRRKIVRRNLNNSFPEKSTKEIKKIERSFYHHLCDYFFETIKLLNISDEEINKRMKFENPEIIDRLTASGNSCLMSLGHHGNWEWVPSVIMHVDPNVKLGFIYKELHSKAFDELFLKIRNRFGPRPIEKKSAYRKMVQAKNAGDVLLVGFLSDQRPPKSYNQYWTNFMNQDTSAQNGMERIAKKLNCSVVYLDIHKVKRGHYLGKFYVITPDASGEVENFITESYFRKLERSVIREPAIYLWTHNRWKYKKPDLSK